MSGSICSTNRHRAPFQTEFVRSRKGWVTLVPRQHRHHHRVSARIVAAGRVADAGLRCQLRREASPSGRLRSRGV